MSVHRDIATAAEDLLRALMPESRPDGSTAPLVDVRVQALREAQNGQPGAQRFDSAGGGASSLWCDVHEQDVRDCELNGHDCDGQTIPLNDPTGEAAIRPDKAAAALRRLERLARKVREAAAAIVDELERERPNVVTNDRAGIGTCDACSKYVDGTKDRLRPHGEHRFCNACRMREARFKAAAS